MCARAITAASRPTQTAFDRAVAGRQPSLNHELSMSIVLDFLWHIRFMVSSHAPRLHRPGKCRSKDEREIDGAVAQIVIRPPNRVDRSRPANGVIEHDACAVIGAVGGEPAV